MSEEITKQKYWVWHFQNLIIIKIDGVEFSFLPYWIETTKDGFMPHRLGNLPSKLEDELNKVNTGFWETDPNYLLSIREAYKMMGNDKLAPEVWADNRKVQVFKREVLQDRIDVLQPWHGNTVYQRKFEPGKIMRTVTNFKEFGFYLCKVWNNNRQVYSEKKPFECMMDALLYTESLPANAIEGCQSPADKAGIA